MWKLCAFTFAQMPCNVRTYMVPYGCLSTVRACSLISQSYKQRGQVSALKRGGQLAELGRSVIWEVSEMLGCIQADLGGLYERVMWFDRRILVFHPSHQSS